MTRNELALFVGLVLGVPAIGIAWILGSEIAAFITGVPLR